MRLNLLFCSVSIYTNRFCKYIFLYLNHLNLENGVNSSPKQWVIETISLQAGEFGRRNLTWIRHDMVSLMSRLNDLMQNGCRLFEKETFAKLSESGLETNICLRKDCFCKSEC